MIDLIIFVALVGLIVWSVTYLIPMPPPFKRAIFVIATVFIVFYVLSAFGLLPSGFRNLRLR